MIVLNEVGGGAVEDTGVHIVVAGGILHCKARDRNAMIRSAPVELANEGFAGGLDRLEVVVVVGVARIGEHVLHRAGLVDDQNEVGGNDLLGLDRNGLSGRVGLELDGIGAVRLEPCGLVEVNAFIIDALCGNGVHPDAAERSERAEYHRKGEESGEQLLEDALLIHF